MEVETVKGVDTMEFGAGDREERARREVSLVRLVFSCMVAGGVQYGWALQLSLLTPYVQVMNLLIKVNFLNDFLINLCDIHNMKWVI